MAFAVVVCKREVEWEVDVEEGTAVCPRTRQVPAWDDYCHHGVTSRL